MADEIFNRLVEESGSSAEHMMLIGLGEPFMDAKIFDRIEYCEQHGVSTLLSTNGTFLDEKTSARLLETRLEHITLSFDGATKESFEYYRKGARFEKVRDNFVRFARMKHERGSKMQVVVQMVRMERNAGEVDDFIRFWKDLPGVDQVRIKEDETNLMRPDAGHAAGDWKYPCHYLWRGPMYVKQSGDVYPCCQSYMLDGAPVGHIGEQPLAAIWNSGGNAAHAAAARDRARRGNRYLLALLHHDSASGAGGRQPDFSREDRAAAAAADRAADVFLEAAEAAAESA